MRELQQGTRRRSEYWVFEKENNNYFRRRAKLGTLLGTLDPGRSPASDHNDDDFSARNSTASGSSPAYCSDSNPVSGQSSPAPNYYNTSPWNPTTSPYVKSPWNNHIIRRSSPNIVWPKGASGHAIMPVSEEDGYLIPGNELLIGSLVREEGHVYSLAAAGDLLYTGSDSKNIRVWKNQKEFSGFKSNSGLVKAIVVHGDRIFTGHQDGKIRVWKASSTNPAVHRRAGTLPTFKDFLKCSMNPNNYVEVRRHRNSPWIKHYDAVSCLSLNEEEGLLYSGSWDKTMKVWRVSDSKCLESINAHDDAINSVVAGFEGLVFTGSADGTVKVWKREIVQAGRRRVKHFYVQTLLRQESAVTALAVLIEAPDSVLYCGSSDGAVNFWEKEKHHIAHGGVLRGHKLAVLCLAAAGNLVFSGSADKTICVWRREPASGVHTCLTVLVGHAGPVKCLAVDEDHGDSDPEDRRRWILYSGSLDKSVKVWKVSETTGEEPNLRLLPQSPLMSQATLPKP